MSWFELSKPSHPAQPSSGDAVASHLAGVPTTASEALKRVKTGVIKYRVRVPHGRHRNRSIFPDPRPADLSRSSSESSDATSSSSPSPVDSQQTCVDELSGKFVGLQIQTTKGEAPSTARTRNRGRSVNVQSPGRSPNALRCQSPPSGPAPPLASPVSAKRAQCGASDMAGAVLGKHPSTAGSAFLADEVSIDFRMKLGGGSQSETFVGLLHTPVDAGGFLVFVKEVPQSWCLRTQMYSEVRANERLIAAASDEVPDPSAIFVARIHAFVSLPDVDRYVFVYDLYHCDLSQVLEHPFSSSRAFDAVRNCPLWITQIASGVDYLHSNGIIHRDIKPGNVLVDSQRNMLLTDLGVSFVSQERKALKPHGLYAYLLCGTGMYMAPEVMALDSVPNEEHLKWRAADPEEKEGIHTFYGPAADWYSFGVLAYEMVATIFGPRGRKSAPAFKFNAQESEVLLNTWDATMENGRKNTISNIGMAAWNDLMKSRNVPEPLWSLLWKLLHTVATQRAAFKDVSKNTFFQAGQQSLFENLVEISFDDKRRPHRGMPDQLTGTQPLYKNSINVTSTHPDFLWKGRTSWIDPSSDLFRGLKGTDEDDDGSDDYY